MNTIITLIKNIYEKFQKDSILKESAALTYVTVLSFIPFLMLIFFIIPNVPGLNFKEALQDLFLSILLPDSVEKGTIYITQILDQKIPSNIFNIVLLSITSFSLFKVINSTFDKILKGHNNEPKSIFYHFSKFIAMIFFGFIFILIIFSSMASPFISQIFNLPFISNISFIVIPFIMFFMVNVFIYIFFSSIKIRLTSLLIGSVSASIFWIIIKLGFDFYIANLSNMEVVFGVIATLPMLLIWIYLNWVTILLGVVIISIQQKTPVNLSEK